MRLFPRLSGLDISALLLVAAAYVVVTTDSASAQECPAGASCSPGTMIPELMAIVAGICITISAIIILRRQRRAKRDEITNLLGDRDWSAAVTRLDGIIVGSNATMDNILTSGGQITERLSPIIDRGDK